ASFSNSFVNRRCFVIEFAFHLKENSPLFRGKSKVAQLRLRHVVVLPGRLGLLRHSPDIGGARS
ncbi:hypothetical protein, partial [Sphingomonas sp. Leaf67]|uniref:hypothetical protein n=1 Tax=Sphingomonas sp. Leaf67 TaxID=1736230 RepID=UPI001F2BD0E4